MAISEEGLSEAVTKKIDAIQTLFKQTDKGDSLKQQFTQIFQSQKTLLAKGKKNSENIVIHNLETFRCYLIKEISTTKISSPKIALTKPDISQIQMNFGESQNAGDSDDDLFTPITSKAVHKTTFTDKTNTLPEKRFRKQVVRPDFVNTGHNKKIKVEIMDDESMGNSSTEGESNSPTKFNGNGVATTNGHNGFNGEGPEFPCPVCRKIFRKKGHMTRHLLTHEPQKPFGCDLCEKRFAAKYSLQMHLLNRHNTDAKPFECVVDGCDRRFTLKKELEQHFMSHKEGFKPRIYPCAQCDLKFITQADVDAHSEMMHPGVVTYEGTYDCSQCNKSFPRPYNLIRHEKTHVDQLNKQYQCNECRKEFGTKNGLQMHLQAHEIEEKVKHLDCHLCGKSFALEQNLELHVTFHDQAEDKPYPCLLCEVRFKSQERLDKHIETHGSSEGRVYPCQFCEKTFPRKYNLIRHELSHTHGRRKPKDGLPTPLPRVTEERERFKREQRIIIQMRNNGNGNTCNNGTSSTDDDETSQLTSFLYKEDFKIIYESNQENSSSKSYQFSVPHSTSELFTTFFGSEDQSDGISTNSKVKCKVLRFEEY